MEKLKSILPWWFWEYTPVVVLASGGLWLVARTTSKISAYVSHKKLLNKFKDTPKDVVILHMFARGVTVPSPSSFALKLETFLRVAQIPYEIDYENPFGPTKKIPWITLNGQHMGDSQLIIQFLSKKFDKHLGSSYTEEEKALGTLIRIMVDEHLYWVGFLWRYYYRAGVDIPTMFSASPFTLSLIRRRLFRVAKLSGFYQGIGRHSEEQVYQIGKDDLRVLSVMLGKKKFILGDEPCDVDCSIFALLAQLIWSSPEVENDLLKYMDEEHPNLRQHTERMRNLYWSDWDSCLSPKN